MKEVLYLNGKYMPLARGKIHVEDRGFQFGDALYETMSVHAGRIFALADHLRRLRASARGVKMRVPLSQHRLGSVLRGLVKRSGPFDGMIYLQLTRGISRRDHVLPGRRTRPTFLAYTRATRRDGAVLRGMKVVTLADQRWSRCVVKTVNLLPNLLAREEAKRRGAHEAVLVARDGSVVEGAATNVFIVERGTIYTAPEQEGMLSGVTRKRLIRLARKAGVRVVEKPFKVPRLRKADEVFLTGTTIEVAPVISVDGKRVGDGHAGPVTCRVRELFYQMIERETGAKVWEARTKKDEGRGLNR